MKSHKKAILIGYDGLMYEMIDKFVKEGIMPNFAKAIKNGAFSRSLPSPTTDTPTNWTSLATGAFTGTHGINTFGVHFPHEPFENVHKVGANIFPKYAGEWKQENALNHLSQAEYIWQAVERAGKKCILINYPGGWPPNVKKSITVDGTGPHSSILSKLSPAHIFLSQTDDIVKYKTQIINSNGRGYDKIIIYQGINFKKKMAVLSVGEESNWLWDDFKTQYGKIKVKFKIRLLSLSKDSKKIKILRSPLFNTNEWAYPSYIADELIDYIQKQDISHSSNNDDVPELSPLCQVYESIEEQANGLGLITKYLANKYNWDLLMVQLHAPDGLNHNKLNEICPKWKLYNKKESKRAWKEFRRQYNIFDKFLGEIVNNCVDKETLVTIVSDHSAIPTTRRVWLTKFFEKAGLVVYKPNTKNPDIVSNDKNDKKLRSYIVDFKKSKVFVGGNPFAQNIWVNLKGREKYGIVKPGKEYEKIVRQSLDVLNSIQDTENGEHPISVALKREDADCFGQWGERVGDIIFYFNPPYTELVGAHGLYYPIAESVYKSNGFFDVPRDGSLQGIHHVFLPSAKFAGFSAGAIFIAFGNGIKKDYRRVAPISTTDVTPTICHYLGVPVTKQCEGRALLDIMDY